MSVIKFTGISKKQYNFELYSYEQYFKYHSGIYIFLRKQLSDYRIIYIGQTDNFVKRLDRDFKYHTQYDCITKNQYTHVALYPVYGSEQRRIDIETDLRRYYSTLCNEQ
jgi:hypothetical protein